MPLELFTSETAIRACACGSEHLALVSSAGDVYTWGRKGGGRLGLPEDKMSGEKVEVPTKVRSLNEIRIRDIACGNAHTVCLTERGRVISWGRENAKLSCLEQVELPGGPYTRALPWRPCYIRMPVKVRSVHCGFEFSVALTECARVYGWGENNKGQLGFKSLGPVSRPTAIHLPEMSSEEFEEDGDGEYVASVSCGANHVCALDRAGRLHSWGDNEFGQCGQGHWDPIAEPRVVCGALEGLKVHGVSCGQHTIAIAGPRKRLFSFGAGTRGQLGLGTEVDINTPRLISSVKDRAFDVIYCGEYHSLGIASGNLVYMWGSNLFGELTQGQKGSLRKVACYTEPHYRGKNLQEVLPEKAEALDNDPDLSSSLVKFECGGVNTLVVKYKDESGFAQTPKRWQQGGARHVDVQSIVAKGTEGRRETPGPRPITDLHASDDSTSCEEESLPARLFPQEEALRKGKDVFKVSPEAVFFPMPPKEECKSLVVLREIKKKRHRRALETYRKVKTDVARKGSPHDKSSGIGRTSFGGNSLETIFNEIVLTPSETEDMQVLRSSPSLNRESAIKSVEKAADHIQKASVSIADASLALGETTENETEELFLQAAGFAPEESAVLSQTEKIEIVQISQEIKKYIERCHGEAFDLPPTPRKGEDLDTYYQDVSHQAHTAASRILQQMQGMKLMYQDLNQAIVSLESENPDANLIDMLLSHHTSMSNGLRTI